MMQSKLFEDPSNIYGMMVRAEEKVAHLESREKLRRAFRLLDAEFHLVSIDNVLKGVFRD